jgi:hypothetical protein
MHRKIRGVAFYNNGFKLLDVRVFFHSQKLLRAGCWWLMPIILTSQDTEQKKMVVQSQPRQMVHETLSQKTFHKTELVEWLRVNIYIYIYI